MVVRVECYPRKARFSLLFEKERFLGRYLVRSIKMEDGGVEWLTLKKEDCSSLVTCKECQVVCRMKARGEKGGKLRLKWLDAVLSKIGITGWRGKTENRQEWQFILEVVVVKCLVTNIILGTSYS